VFDLVIVRALGDDASGYESDIYMAVEQCIAMGADVINLSLGSTLMSDFARDVYTSAVEEHGIIMVAAAGNDGDETKNFPASHPSVISVGAAEENGNRYFSSVYNDQVELVAPGHEILSTGATTHALKASKVGFAFTAERLVGTPDEARTGMLAYCGSSSDGCPSLELGGICLFDSGGDSSPAEALVACVEAGGAGAVFFNDDAGLERIETLYIPNGMIPSVCISKASAMALIETLEVTGSFEVTIGDEGDDNLEYTYELRSGTSMASPHVAASAGLLKSHFNGCSNHQIRYALAYTARHPNSGCDNEYGYGMIKVKDAYDWLKEQGGCQGWDVEAISQGGCTTTGPTDNSVRRIEMNDQIERA
jgi:serine protease